MFNTLTQLELMDLRDKTINDIEDIGKQLSRKGHNEYGATLFSTPQAYLLWRGNAITARQTKLESLRAIKSELRERYAVNDFWYRHGNAAIALLQKVVQVYDSADDDQALNTEINTVLDAYESELITIGLQHTTNTTSTIPS